MTKQRVLNFGLGSGDTGPWGALRPNNPCTDEEILFVAKLHSVVHLTVDSTGAEHLSTMGRYISLKGEGASGTRYTGAGGGSFHFQNPTPTTVFKSMESFRINAEGSNNNFFLMSTFHITVNANGELTGEHYSSKTECR